MEQKRICIVEDKLELREALGMMIEFTDEYKVAGTYSTAEDALKSIPKNPPHAVLMDINLPNKSGIECVTELKMKFPNILFLMCTSHDDTDKIFDSLKAGASGYVLKTEGPAKILEALEDMINGGSPMTASIARKVVSSFQSKNIESDIAEKLTAREQEVLEKIADGLMNKEVANLLNLSVGTVRTHIQNIYEKLHVNTRVEAVNVYLKRK